MLILQAFALSTALSIGAGGAYADAGHDHNKESIVGQPGKASEVTRTVKIDTLDQSYNIKQVQVKPGETIRFVITNKSSIKHEFGIGTHHDQQAHREIMKSMPDMEHNDANMVTLKAGETKEIIWKFSNNKEALKELEFSCNIPGHAEGGMIGMFRSM
jgi:uncharacterized cupredoxin-like copper-binding protein